MTSNSPDSLISSSISSGPSRKKTSRTRTLTKSSSTSATIYKADPPKLNQTVKWILSGATEHDIREAMLQAWPDDDLAALLLAAIAQIRQSAAVDSATVKGWCFEATSEA